MFNRHDIAINYEKDLHNIKQLKEENNIFT
jgi:hypothetical protein